MSDEKLDTLRDLRARTNGLQAKLRDQIGPLVDGRPMSLRAFRVWRAGVLAEVRQVDAAIAVLKADIKDEQIARWHKGHNDTGKAKGKGKAKKKEKARGSVKHVGGRGAIKPVRFKTINASMGRGPKPPERPAVPPVAPGSGVDDWREN